MAMNVGLLFAGKDFDGHVNDENLMAMEQHYLNYLLSILLRPWIRDARIERERESEEEEKN